MRRARRLSEQVVVITGASSGIGRCAAQHLAAKGARVVLTARRTAALEALAAEIEEAGGRALAVPGDVTRQADMDAVARAAVERFDGLDTWVNGAGIYLQAPFQATTDEEYRRILEVNVFGVIHGTRAALGWMLPRGRGAIIQVSSIVGKRGAPLASAYSMSKHALNGFTEALRSELWGRGVRISMLYLPSIDTPIYQNARGKLGTVPKPVPPVMPPERAARAIAELAESGRTTKYLGLFRHIYLGLNRISPALSDFVLSRARDFTVSDVPANGDNLYEPLQTVPPTIRGGWSRPGWNGLTVGEVVRVLPLETLAGAALLGFLAARLAR